MKTTLTRVRRGAVGLALSALIMSGIAPPAVAADAPTRAQAEGSALSGDGVLDLDDLLKDQSAFAPTVEGGSSNNNDMNLTVLGGLDLPLGTGINAPLLKDVLQVGALGQYAKATKGGTSEAAAGAVTGEGLLAVNGADASQSSSVTLSPVLKGLGLDSLINELKVDVKAVASRATAEPGKLPQGEYAIAGVNLALEAKAIANLTKTLKTTVQGVDSTLEAAVGEQGATNAVLNSLRNDVLGPINRLLLGLGSVKIPDDATIAIDTDLWATVSPVLEETLSDPDESVSVRLSDGKVTVDLAKIMDSVRSDLPQANDRTVCTDPSTKPGGLNCLPANTELLQAKVINAVVTRLTGLVNGATTKLEKVVKTALSTTKVNITVGLDVYAVLGIIPVAKTKLHIATSLGQLVGWDATPLTKDDVKIDAAILGIPVGSMVNAIVSPLATKLVPALGSVLKPVVEGALNTTLIPAVRTLVTGVVSALDPLLSEVQKLLSLKVNVQQEKPGRFIDPRGNDSLAFTERALRVGLLPQLRNGEGLLTVNLGGSTVVGEPKAYTTALTASPQSVAPGADVTLAGTGFEPGEEVTIKVPGGADITTTADANGALPTGQSAPKHTVGATQSAGQLSFTATGAVSNTPAVATVTVSKNYTTSLSVIPGEQFPGRDVTVKGTGFEPNEDITLILGGTTIEVKATDQGELSQGWTVPLDQAAGTLDLSAEGAVSKTKATSKLTILGLPSVKVAPGEGPVGTEVQITGGKFLPNAEIPVTMGGKPVGTAETGSDGKLLAGQRVRVPKGVPGGTTQVVVNDGTNPEAKEDFVVTASFSVDPDHAKRGEKVSVTGDGFAPNTELTITLGGKDVPEKIITDANGAFAAADVTVAPDAALGAGAATVTDHVVATPVERDFSVDADAAVPAVVVNPTSGAAGSALTSVSLSGFPATTEVTLTLGGQEIGKVATNDQGAALLTGAQVPAGLAVGRYDVVGTADQVSAKTGFEVVKDGDPNVEAQANSNASANASSAATADSSSAATADDSANADATANADANANANAAASAAAAAEATADKDAAAAAAEAAAFSDSNADQSAAADATADAAAQAAAEADASKYASADATSEANASAESQAAASSDANSDANSSAESDATSSSSSDASSEASTTAESNSNSNASADSNASANANATATANSSSSSNASSTATANASSDAQGNGAVLRASVQFPELTPGPTTVQKVTGTGFKPGEEVNATVYSTPQKLDPAKADKSGTVKWTFAVPVGYKVGRHHIEVVGVQSGQVKLENNETEFVVKSANAEGGSGGQPTTPPANAQSGSDASSGSNASGDSDGHTPVTGPGGLSVTGASSALPIVGGVALALLLAGAFLLAIRQRRRRG